MSDVRSIISTICASLAIIAATLGPDIFLVVTNSFGLCGSMSVAELESEYCSMPTIVFRLWTIFLG